MKKTTQNNNPTLTAVWAAVKAVKRGNMLFLNQHFDAEVLNIKNIKNSHDSHV